MEFDSGVTSSELASLVSLARIQAIDPNMVDREKLSDLLQKPTRLYACKSNCLW